MPETAARKTQSHTLCLAGGCAHNSVWVGKIAKNTPFKKIHVAPASHDAGIAVGAAVSAANREIHAEGRHWALLGPDLSEVNEDAKKDLGFDVEERTFADDTKLCEWMVKELCDGKIIGLVHGRMEFGPRALGNRSILADPRVKEMKERLNERVKHREPFRPFAASVLWEYQKKWFKDSFTHLRWMPSFRLRIPLATRFQLSYTTTTAAAFSLSEKTPNPFTGS